ncbi:hypothetical protein ACE1RU_003764 [Vibrio mimicus]
MKDYHLEIAGEIRFGPQYYSLKVKGVTISKYVYGSTYSILGDGRYLAIEEWLTTNYHKGPITRVAIFDLELSLVARLKIVDKGFVLDFKLRNGIFSYRKYFKGQGKFIESELDWSSIQQWESIHT